MTAKSPQVDATRRGAKGSTSLGSSLSPGKATKDNADLANITAGDSSKAPGLTVAPGLVPGLVPGFGGGSAMGLSIVASLK